ncbi:hypothetical protein Pmani_029629 [Petrolisthes manimaculis]|uniref:Large ribosomal subunit protein P2 n=1 Tax=Petrolisthes manimaculis TaxID=1843537 RepID=A0AAE1NX91_9EUCA|nr:hypothetical protein Pmani_029629 [Petrolisthes manimaculis]
MGTVTKTKLLSGLSYQQTWQHCPLLPSFVDEGTRALGSTQIKMRHVAAFLLAAMGSSQPNAAVIKTILGSVGVEADDKQLDILIQKMAGKNVDQILAAGSELISAVPAGGGGGGAAAPGAAADAKPAAEEKEEKKEEPEEESDDDMGFGLFD